MKFNIYTLGCKVNTYESNVMRDQLCNQGYIEVATEEPADISIINTCTVTNTADHKSMKTIKHAIRQNPNAIIVVSGCFSQNKKQVAIEGVDIVIGNQGKSKIVEYIETFLQNQKKIQDVREMKQLQFEPMKLNNFNKTRAFVKIQDGCNNFCTYCIVPYVRGRERSREPRAIIEEVQEIAKQGYKEVTLLRSKCKFIFKSRT